MVVYVYIHIYIYIYLVYSAEEALAETRVQKPICETTTNIYKITQFNSLLT